MFQVMPWHNPYSEGNNGSGNPNMNMPAVSVILIDARKGVLPQTRRHAYIAHLLGVRHIVVAVNKMDLVGFDETVFERIRTVTGSRPTGTLPAGTGWPP